jgi:hypothetical protein
LSIRLRRRKFVVDIFQRWIKKKRMILEPSDTLRSMEYFYNRTDRIWETTLKVGIVLPLAGEQATGENIIETAKQSWKRRVWFFMSLGKNSLAIKTTNTIYGIVWREPSSWGC